MSLSGFATLKRIMKTLPAGSDLLIPTRPARLVTIANNPSHVSLTASDMDDALKAAFEILEFAKSKLKALGYEYAP